LVARIQGRHSAFGEIDKDQFPWKHKMSFTRHVRVVTIAAIAIPSTTAHSQSTRPDAATIAAAVDALATRAIAAGLAPGLGLAVTMDGKTIYARSHGMADATARVRADDRTLWYIASTSKSFTGFAVSLLATEGVLGFDTPIAQLLPRGTWHPDAHASELTLARFLSHTHYLNDNAVVMSAAFTGAIPEARWPELTALAAPAGSNDLVYSNFGYNVAAMVIDALRPEGWRRFLETRIYAPVGMSNTFTRVSGLAPARIARPHAVRQDGSFVTETFFKTDATMNSAGGHMATMADLARWTIVQMDSGRIDGRQVFPAAAVARSHTMIAPHTRDQAKRFSFFVREGWGAGWDIGTYEGERMVSRFGGYHSFYSHLSFLPARRIGFAGVSNGGAGNTVADILAAYAYDLEAGRAEARTRAEGRINDLIARLPGLKQSVVTADSTRAARQKQPLAHPLNDFAATYSDPAFGQITFSISGGALAYRWGALSGPVEIYNAATNQMRLEFAGSGAVAAFEFDSTGPAKAVTVQGARLVRRQ
jgi:CubicO group peptidase (beta-lactamase class C family)